MAHIQPENLQNVQKKCFWQKAPGVNELKIHRHLFLMVLEYSLFPQINNDNNNNNNDNDNDNDNDVEEKVVVIHRGRCNNKVYYRLSHDVVT